ncbi:MAG: acetylglutamate kinase [Bacteroides sp.]|nr:acetylglutamate kinase [Bacteroides sp.]MCM1413163.1 acetylglutamate kinase [Bacteroides sp.]MCM1472095.1 acetylglutamate kinase [Bacteroides sp.]
MADRIKVVKIGGNVVDAPEAFDRFIKSYKRLAGPKILIHGGGKEATRLSAALGIETTMIDGRRVTDKETLDVVTMVYAGLINKRIVARMQAIGIDAIGLSGADAGVITATRRRPEPIDYGYVGDLDPLDVDESVLSRFLKDGITPVICPIMHDGEGQLLNCNADTVASTVAVAVSRISPVDLIFCFEKPGVLSDVNDDNSVIRYITPEIFAELREQGTIQKGMLPKLENAIKAVKGGVSEVYIKCADNLLSASGTLVTL